MQLSVLQFDLNWTLAYIYGPVIKLNKIEVILLGFKMKALFIFKLIVKGCLSKYDNMMVIEGEGVCQIMTVDDNWGGGGSDNPL